MVAWLRILAALSGLALSNAQSNLPDVAPGLFNASARIAIDAPLADVWEALVDFPSYPNWNPFVRSAVMTNEFLIPLPADQQRPTQNGRVTFRVQIPPLPLPVDASTPDNPLHTQTSFENITALQPKLGRAAWTQLMIPTALLDSTRWSAVSTLANGSTLYESREVYRGSLAGTLQTLYGKGLQEAFEAQAQALKLLLE